MYKLTIKMPDGTAVTQTTRRPGITHAVVQRRPNQDTTWTWHIVNLCTSDIQAMNRARERCLTEHLPCVTAEVTAQPA